MNEAVQALDKEEEWEKQAEGSEGDSLKEATAHTPAAQSSVHWKRYIFLSEGSCRMPALLARRAAGCIPAAPVAYSFRLINGSQFCACCVLDICRDFLTVVPRCNDVHLFIQWAGGGKLNPHSTLAANHKMNVVFLCTYAWITLCNSSWDYL